MKNERDFLVNAIKGPVRGPVPFLLLLALLLAGPLTGIIALASSPGFNLNLLANGWLNKAQPSEAVLAAKSTSTTWLLQESVEKLLVEKETILRLRANSRFSQDTYKQSIKRSEKPTGFVLQKKSQSTSTMSGFLLKTSRRWSTISEEKTTGLSSWQEKVAQWLRQGPVSKQVLKQVVAYLETLWNDLPATEKITASACLAFFYRHLSLKEKEYHWLSLHWEKYRSSFWNFSFLPQPWSNQLLEYLNYWEKNYPQLFDLAFTKPAQPLLEKWPDSLTLVAVIRSEAFYKILREGLPVSGGRVKAGLNLMEIPLPQFSPRARKIKYILELKKEDLIVRYQLELHQNLTLQLGSATQGGQQSRAAQVENRSRQLQVFLYWQDKLLAQSQIIQDLKENINRDLPPRDGVFRPFGPYQEKTNPQNFGVSVFQAIQLLGDFLKKKLGSDKSSTGGRSGGQKGSFSLTHLTPEKIRTLNFSLHSPVEQGETSLYQGSLRLQVSFQEGTAFWRK